MALVFRKTSTEMQPGESRQARDWLVAALRPATLVIVVLTIQQFAMPVE